MRRLVVAGGGIAGLSGARAARLEADRLGVPLAITLLEAAPRAGGKILTEHVEGVPLEWGPDSFLASKPGAVGLATALGLGGDLVAPGSGRAYLLFRGRLRPVPAGTVLGVPATMGALLRAARGGLLDVRGVLRAAIEPGLPGRPSPEASVAEAVRRRLGSQVAERLVGPLLVGVHGSPAEELGMDVLPQLAGARSLMAAARRARRAGPASFRSLRGGLGRLAQALLDAMAGEDLRTDTAVLGLGPGPDGYRVAVAGGALEADAVLLAVPAGAAAMVLAGEAPAAAGPLGEIRYRASAIVHLRWEQGALRRPLDAAGYLAADDGVVAACSWLNAKWPHLELRDLHLRAVVVDPASIARPDLADRVAEEVGRVMGAYREPTEVRVHRWGEAMPVYAPGHGSRVGAARSALPPGVALAGAAYDGVGLPDCIRSGEEAGRELVRFLADRTG